MSTLIASKENKRIPHITKWLAIELPLQKILQINAKVREICLQLLAIEH